MKRAENEFIDDSNRTFKLPLCLEIRPMCSRFQFKTSNDSPPTAVDRGTDLAREKERGNRKKERIMSVSVKRHLRARRHGRERQDVRRHTYHRRDADGAHLLATLMRADIIHQYIFRRA